MLQVGYGDISPTTALEQMTAVFLMLIGGGSAVWTLPLPCETQMPEAMHL